MKMDYSKFNNAVNMDEIKAGIEEAKAKSKDFGEIPVNVSYDVEIESMELTESKKGDPMVKIVFQIVDGEYAKSKIWMNQVVTKGLQIHILNEFLRSLKTSVEVGFEDYAQYGEMLEDIFDEVDGNFEYNLYYGQNKDGYNTYRIKKVYKLEE